MFTFKIYTLGCKVNQYDSQTLRRYLEDFGWQNLKLSDKKSADLVVVNTCTVTTNAHRKDKRMLNKARQENPQAKVVLMGCWYKVYPEIIDRLDADLFWSVGHLNKLGNKIKKLLINEDNKKDKSDKSDNKVGKDIKKNRINKIVSKITPPGNGERSRYFMKVQDGCEQFCSYCVIPYSRGRLQSRSVKEIIKEIQAVEKVGYGEVVLCGIHLGLYNQEKNSLMSQKDLAYLIKEIINQTTKIRVRISSIEINDINNTLINLLKNEDRFCKHLHIPLQGGDDKILRLMNRPYDLQYFQNKIKEIRRVVPLIAITADVIVGFPSETEEQFKNTRQFIKKLQLSKLHVFPYSKHQRTVAAKMSGHLAKKIKKERADKLRGLSEKLWQKYQETIKRKKKKFKVIVENVQAGEAIVKTEYYFNIKVVGPGLGRLNVGELIEVTQSGEQYLIV